MFKLDEIRTYEILFLVSPFQHGCDLEIKVIKISIKWKTQQNEPLCKVCQILLKLCPWKGEYYFVLFQTHHNQARFCPARLGTCIQKPCQTSVLHRNEFFSPCEPEMKKLGTRGGESRVGVNRSSATKTKLWHAQEQETPSTSDNLLCIYIGCCSIVQGCAAMAICQVDVGTHVDQNMNTLLVHVSCCIMQRDPAKSY